MVSPRTVIEAFLPSRGDIALELVYDTANAAGIADQPIRLALRRMVAAGEVVQSGRGRQATAALTAVGRERLDQDRLAVRLAFTQDQGLDPWDGRWRLLAVSAPESERAIRDGLRRTLVEAGAALVSTGLYVSPHDLAIVLDSSEYLVHAEATDLDVRGVTDPQAIAELLWPAAPTIAAYDAIDDAIRQTGPPLVRQLHLAEALEHALRPDPLLPPELRASPWPPAVVRRRWYDAWMALTEQLPEELLYRGWLSWPTSCPGAWQWPQAVPARPPG
ncbi:PaaX family transcriptional regulator [Kribbella sandramycini]|uniref:PaaX family transcriptional regulator n=1 Tax=Kribbella sandramycini TaxID=60450 RepID=A0A7Y4P1R3_9ACTN|nr:PaaX family transcriptional regulator [Kribbella sandramycini]MBB6566814.1 phenylacetic acid degradation operon negative regulatory protein [Kribbella sandramycini]NOL44537.1 PaaX family transcriptional regulator [Kribbella sandramycini]